MRVRIDLMNFHDDRSRKARIAEMKAFAKVFLLDVHPLRMDPHKNCFVVLLPSDDEWTLCTLLNVICAWVALFDHNIRFGEDDWESMRYQGEDY